MWSFWGKNREEIEQAKQIAHLNATQLHHQGKIQEVTSEIKELREVVRRVSHLEEKIISITKNVDWHTRMVWCVVTFLAALAVKFVLGQLNLI